LIVVFVSSVRAMNVPLKMVRFAPQTTWRANTSNESIRLGSIPSLFTSHKNNNTKHTIDCCFCFFCSTQAIVADWTDLMHFQWMVVSSVGAENRE
jgi:hypothetical protein